MRAVEIRAERGSNSALHYSGSTLSGVTNPFCRSSKRKRFDFTKSAICRRFCKVRLLKHPTGMFYPLRMTQKGDALQYFSISPHPSALPPPSPQEKAFCLCSLLKKMTSVVYFVFNYRQSSPSYQSDASHRAFSWGEGGPQREYRHHNINY